jgi:hypothetical protein
MPNSLREMDRVELVNLKRLAYVLKGLSAAEIETLEILLDDDTSKTIAQSLEELEAGERIPIEDW